jgi:UDP-GlcNAc:undecaprenyl-phosphate GlcNAc-1-phosphate transferase
MIFIAFIVACVVTLSVGWLIQRFDHLHGWASHDATNSGPQKFHTSATPRIGGLAMGVGLLAAVAVATFNAAHQSQETWWFLLACLPAYLSGLAEDLSKKIGPDIRLWASFLSALLAILFFNVVLDDVSIQPINQLLRWYPLALLLSVFAVGGVAHAVNIIDGYNGLAGMVSLLTLSTIAWVCWQVGDQALLLIAVSLAGATLGFLYWNWPQGRIFAGDGGAYLWGVSIGMLCVLLVGRNPSVSPWFAVLVVCYPVAETLFTIYRRKMVHKTASGMPDARHLHQLIYRRVLAMPTMSKLDSRRAYINSATSPFLWVLVLVALVPATVFWQHTEWLAVFVLVFVMTYLWLYRAIVLFKLPGWLRGLGRWMLARAIVADGSPHAKALMISTQ